MNKIASPKETVLSLILLGELNDFLKDKKVVESSTEASFCLNLLTGLFIT